MSAITQEQVIGLEANQRFKEVSKQFIRDRATYLMAQDGTINPPDQTQAGLTPANWARQRSIAAGISLHPNSQDYNEWSSQFSMLLKGQDVWVAPPDPLPESETIYDATISAMIASGKFEELSEITYALRAQRVEF